MMKFLIVGVGVGNVISTYLIIDCKQKAKQIVDTKYDSITKNKTKYTLVDYFNRKKYFELYSKYELNIKKVIIKRYI